MPLSSAKLRKIFQVIKIHHTYNFLFKKANYVCFEVVLINVKVGALEIGTHIGLNLHRKNKINEDMAQISSSDSLFISASAMGREFFSFVGTGLESLATIITEIRRMPEAPRGMVTLSVRNASRGWSQNRSFYI